MAEPPACTARATLVERALDALAGGFLVCAADGSILLANRGSARLLDLPEGQLLGSNVEACFASTPSLKETASWLPTGEEARLRTRLLTPGLEHEVVVSLARIDGEAGDDTWVAVFRPTQEEQTVMAEVGDWSESLGRVVAGFAHEVRNPLAAIHGLVDLWADGIENPDEHEILSRLRNQITRLDRLVRALVAFDLPSAPSVATHEVGEVLVQARLRLEGSQVPLPAGFEAVERGAYPPVSTDPDFCAAILEELVRNAHEASGGAMPPEIRVEPATAPEARRRDVTIAVVDHGPGIAARLRARIFEPFFTTKRNRIGIGLTMARILARRIGARLGVRSAPGEETLFTLTLPGGGR